MTRNSLDRTVHGDRRAIDRGIPELAIQLVRDYGTEAPAGSGTLRYDFNKKSWAEIERLFGNWRLKEMEKFRSVYLIVSADDVLITAAYRK